MKQTIEIPWSIGDICWSIMENFDRNNIVWTNTLEVLECQIDAIEVILSEKETRFWFQVAFDTGKVYPNHGRFTYGMGVPNIYASREEAEAALKNKKEGR